MLKTVSMLLASALVLAACERATTGPADTLAAGDAVAEARSPAENGLVRTTWPSAEDPGPPFYARIEPFPPHLFVVDGWAVIQFARDPACIPADFNLLVFFDVPAVFGCSLTVKGFSLWLGEPFSSPPMTSQSRGTGAVPFWFIPADVAVGAIQDGDLTIGELAGLPGRIVGHASRFSEVLHPLGGPHPNPMLIQNASGRLEDGRRFKYHVKTVGSTPETIQLHFE